MIFTSSITLPFPIGVVWNLLLDCRSWGSWWGGSLKKVDPRWGRGGQLCWSRGDPSTIVEFEPLKALAFKGGSGARSRFVLDKKFEDTTEITLEDDYSLSSLRVTNPDLVQARCDMILRRLGQYARAHVRTGWWEFWKKAYTQVAVSAELPAKLINKDLAHSDPDVRCAAVKRLVESGTPGAIGLLIQALTDGDEKVRLAAANGLCGLGWTPSDTINRNAYLVAAQKWDDLAALGPGGVLPLISVHRLHNGRYTGDPAQRAMETLGKMGTTAVAPLIEIFRLRKDLPPSKGELWTAVYAADVLGEIADPAAVDVLIEALKSPDEYVRKEAAKALGKIGDKRAIDPIMLAMKEGRLLKSPCTGPLALTALGAPQATDAWLNLLFASADGSDRWFAARCLGDHGDRKAVPALMKALSDSNETVRREAAEALGKLGDPVAVDALVRVLDDRDESVRRKAKAALNRLGHTI